MSKELADQVSNSLKVVETHPKNLEDIVNLDTAVEVIFNDDVDANTLNSSNFHFFRQNTTIKGEIKYAAEERKAVFVPEDELRPKTEYSISLTSGIKSVAGYSLEPFSFTFYTQSEGYSLAVPEIIHPANNEKVSQSNIKWDWIEGAGQYDIEIARRPDFKDLVYSAKVTGKNKVTPDITSGEEYFLRTRASKVVTDELLEKEVVMTYQELAENYVGNNHYRVSLDKDLAPVKEILPYDTYPQQIGAKVFKQDCYESRDTVDDIVMQDYGHNTEGNIYIEDAQTADFIIKYPFEAHQLVEFFFKYPKIIARSPWSDTVSFYYDKSIIDFEAMIEHESQHNYLISVLNTIQVEPQIKAVPFKVFYDDIEIEDMDIELQGNSANNTSTIGDTLSHGLISGDIKHEIVIPKDDLNQVNSERYEYTLNQEHTPVIEIIEATAIQEDAEETLDITDATTVIGYNDDLIEIDNELLDIDKVIIEFYYARTIITEETEDYTLIEYRVPSGLKQNNKYTIQVTIGGQTFQDYFYTKLEPLYNTVQAVRNSEVGPYLEDIEDEDILMQLYEASQYVDSEADREHLEWNKFDRPPYPVKKFVLEKTKKELLMFRDHYKRMKYRSASLADFDITSPDAGQFQPLMDELTDKVSRWRKKIIGPQTDYATPHKNDAFLGRANLERTRRNTLTKKRNNSLRRHLGRYTGEGDGSVIS